MEMRRRTVEMKPTYGSTFNGSSDEEDEARMLTENGSSGTYAWIVGMAFIALCAIGAVVIGSIALDLSVKSTNKLNSQSHDILWKTLQDQRLTSSVSSSESAAAIISDVSNVVVPTNSSINAISLQRNEDNTAGIYFSANLNTVVFDCGMVATIDNVTDLPVISFVGTVETTSKRAVSRTEHTIMTLTMADDGTPLVGIGTTDPESALDVNGDITLVGTIDITGSIILNGENITQVSGPNGTTIYIDSIRSPTNTDINLFNSIIPHVHNSISLGNLTNAFADLYVRHRFFVAEIRSYPGVFGVPAVTIKDDLVPLSSNAVKLGNSTKLFEEVHTSNTFTNTLQSTDADPILLLSSLALVNDSTIDIGVGGSPSIGLRDVYISGILSINAIASKDGSGAVNISCSLIPEEDGIVDVGSISKTLGNIYGLTVFTDNLRTIHDTITVFADLVGGFNVGTTSNGIANVYVAGTVRADILQGQSSAIKLSGNMNPLTNNTSALGSSALRYSVVYTVDIQTTTITAATITGPTLLSGAITMDTSILPTVDNSKPLGSAIKRYSTVYTVDVQTTTITAPTINGPTAVVGALTCDTAKTDYFMWIGAVGKLMVDTSLSTACVVSHGGSAGDWNCGFSGSAVTASLYGLTIEIPSRTASNKGLNITSIGVSYTVTTAISSITPTLTRVRNNNGSARTFTNIPLTGSLSASASANPYYTTLTVTSPAYDNTATDFYVFELGVGTPGVAWAWTLKGINVQYSYNTL
jgi:hypothetical protein